MRSLDILHALQKKADTPTSQNSAINLELPSHQVFKRVDPDTSGSKSPSTSSRRRITYKLTNPSHCLRQVLILLSILSGPLAREATAAGLSEHAPWLLDSLYALCNAQVQWDPPIEVAIVPLIQIALSFACRNVANGNTKSIIQGKACIVLSFLIAELATRPAELLGGGDAPKVARTSLCQSIICLTKTSISNKAISRLVAAHVVGHCEYLSVQVPELGPGTDFAVRPPVLTKLREVDINKKIESCPFITRGIRPTNAEGL